MIDLTPLEVRQKKGDFRRTMRGYEPALVDDFLDLVAERLETLVRENRAFAEDVARLREQVADFRERERALTEALVTAQEMREELRRQAEKDADLMRREAETEMAEQRQLLVGELEREEQALMRARARRGQFLKSFRTFLERELSEIEVVEQTIMVEALEPAEPEAAPQARPAGGKKKGGARQGQAQGQDGGGEGTASPEAREPVVAPQPSAAAREPATPPEPLRELLDDDDMDWLSSVLREEER